MFLRLTKNIMNAVSLIKLDLNYKSYKIENPTFIRGLTLWLIVLINYELYCERPLFLANLICLGSVVRWESFHGTNLAQLAALYINRPVQGVRLCRRQRGTEAIVQTSKANPVVTVFCNWLLNTLTGKAIKDSICYLLGFAEDKKELCPRKGFKCSGRSSNEDFLSLHCCARFCSWYLNTVTNKVIYLFLCWA